MYKVLKMSLGCGRQGEITYVGIVDKETLSLKTILERENPTLNAYEELGKHSDICFDFNEVYVVGHEVSEEICDILDSIGITTGFDFIFHGVCAMLQEIMPNIEGYLKERELDYYTVSKEPVEVFDDIIEKMGSSIGFNLTGSELKLIMTNGEY